jgi:hypothetical protein
MTTLLKTIRRWFRLPNYRVMSPAAPSKNPAEEGRPGRLKIWCRWLCFKLHRSDQQWENEQW